MAAVRGGLNPATRGNRRVSAPRSGLDVRDFPSLTLPAGKLIYRIHRDGPSPWWFSHDGSQRFDLLVGDLVMSGGECVQQRLRKRGQLGHHAAHRAPLRRPTRRQLVA
jgi:hypothetical protein